METKTILMAILLFAILIEGTVEYLKLSFQKQMCGEIIGAFVFALVVAIAYKLDFFKAYLGLEPIIPYLGNVLTALVMARGSNYMFDLIGKFTEGEQTLEKILTGDEAKPEDEINEDVVSHEADEGVG